MDAVLSGPEGTAIDPAAALRQFQMSMAAPEKDEPVAKAPPRVTDAPAQPEPSPRKPARAKDRPRVIKAAPAPVPAAPASEPRDYTADLMDTTRMAFTLALPFSPADAGAIAMHGPGIAVGANGLAQVNSRARQIVEFVTANSAMLAFAGAVLPLGVQFAANHGVKLGVLGGMTSTREELTEFAAETADLMAEAARRQRDMAMAMAQRAMADAGPAPAS